MQTIPLADIHVGDRQRSLYSNIDKLAASLARYGLIQPIVLDDSNNLIAGGRRLRAAQSLSWTSIPFVRFGELTDDARAELELEENVRREALTWQETCTAIMRIHNLRSQSAALSGEPWGYEQTGDLFGKAKSNVWYACEVASRLPYDDDLRKSASLADAIRLLVSRKEREAAALLVKTAASSAPPAATRSIAPQYELDLDDESNVIPVTPAAADADAWLRSHVLFGDSLDLMAKMPPASVDHIYTDPPYAIDMSNLQQEGGGQDVTRVRAEHDVSDNLSLLARFLPLAYRVLTPRGFLVFWCDQDNWAWLKNRAEAAGFAVQRWPIIWCKTDPCSNQMAYSNLTKATEIAMLCRMPEARLATIRGINYWSGGNDRDAYGTLHPFWKPTHLHRWILNSIAIQGQTILDPFAGEGSIPVACIPERLNPIAIELVDIHYIQLQNNMRKEMFG